MKKIFKIDAALYLLGILTAVTGFGFHLASHHADHHAWVVWAWVHTLISVAFVAMVALHLYTHKGWIKALKSADGRQKRRITLFLSFLFAVVCVSGIALLFVDGANTHAGLLHYKMAIVFAVVALGHAARRFKIFRKGINKNQKRNEQSHHPPFRA